MSRDDIVTQQLCDMIEFRQVTHGAEALLGALDHPSESIRFSAADSLAKIEVPSTGPALLAHLRTQPSDSVRLMLACAIGTTRYEPGIPALIASLKAAGPAERGGVVWSLGHLRVESARQPMLEAQATEPTTTSSSA